jgi:CRP-like cAMP-binding protein
VISHSVEDQLARNRLLGRVSPAERARLAPFLRDVFLAAAQTLTTPDEPATAIWFPYDAVLSSVATTEEGHAVEVGLIGAEGIAGVDLLLGGPSSPTTIVVQVPGAGARFPARDFVRHVVDHGGELRGLLLRYTSTLLATVAQIAACNATHPVERRLARWLAMARDRTGRDVFPLTHEFVAMMIGVRRASVTLVAGHLRELGAIDYVRGEITITDRARLEREACDCYLLIRSRAETIFG